MVISGNNVGVLRKGASNKPLIRIAILMGTPFTAQNYERIGMPYLSKYFEVIVFDCTRWLQRDHEGYECEMAHWEQNFLIKSKSEFEKRIKQIRPKYAIDFIGYGEFTSEILRILKKYNVKFVTQKMGTLPTSNLAMRILFSIRLFFSDRKVLRDKVKNNASLGGNCCIFNHAVRILFLKISQALKKIMALTKLISMPGSISLVAGNKSLDIFSRGCSEIIWTGSNDFYTFKKVKKELSLCKSDRVAAPFILFIDDCLPNALDWILLGIPAPISSANYYPMLNRFFAKIESMHNMPVKIAAHPNSATDKEYTDNMGGREVFHGTTASLAIQSSIVLIHGSTAVSFAILARKPIISMTSRELDGSRYGLHVRAMSKSIGSPLIFIDGEDSVLRDLAKHDVDEKKYKLYESSYLCNDSSLKSEPWDGLIKYIQKEL